jgi:hypothetical protein
MKARWQVEQMLTLQTPSPPLVFFDEPGAVSFGCTKDGTASSPNWSPWVLIRLAWCAADPDHPRLRHGLHFSWGNTQSPGNDAGALGQGAIDIQGLERQFPEVKVAAR